MTNPADTKVITITTPEHSKPIRIEFDRYDVACWKIRMDDDAADLDGTMWRSLGAAMGAIADYVCRTQF